MYVRGFDRLKNFSDAVVAIAITLLIFPLTNLAAGMGHQNVLQLFAQNWPAFFGFLLSFLVVAKTWLDNHNMFRDLAG